MILIVATDVNGGIGKDNKIPWKCKEDMRRFRDITTNCDVIGKSNVIIMGRKTWESIGRRRLPNRINIVISTRISDSDFRSGDDSDSFTYLNKPDFIAKNKQEVLDWIDSNKNIINKTFVIGGSEIYKLFMDRYYGDTIIYLTIMKGNYNCDTFFPLNNVYNDYKLVSVEPQTDHVNLVFKFTF